MVKSLLKMLFVFLTAYIVTGVQVSSAQEQPADTLARITASIPRTAKVKVQMRVTTAPSPLDVDRAVERARRNTLRQSPHSTHTTDNMRTYRRAIQQINDGYTEQVDYTFFWSPDTARVESTKVEVGDKTPSTIGSYYLDGASYQLSRSLHTATVTHTCTIFSGCLAEAVFFYGFRLDRLLDPNSLHVVRSQDSVTLTGALSQKLPVIFYPTGSVVRVLASLVHNYLPDRLEVAQRGKLREATQVRAFQKFGSTLYPSEIEVTRYRNDKVTHHWTFQIGSIEVGDAIKAQELVPGDGKSIQVFDSRLANSQVNYTLKPAQSFPSLQELQRMAADPKLVNQPTAWTAYVRLGALCMTGIALLLLVARYMGTRRARQA